MSWRYQRGNHNPYIKEEQTTQCLEDTNGWSESVYQRWADSIMSWRYQRGNQNPNTDSDYLFGIFKTLYCLFFLEVRILITPLVSSRHYVVCSSLKYGFWLPICIFKTFCCHNVLKIQTGNQNRTSMRNRQYNVLKIPNG
jgi:hypothetical protein